MRVSKLKDIWDRFSGKGVYPHELAFVLDSPLRNLILPAAKLADRLHLVEDSKVLEIGPGPGYFSPEVARRTPRGRLVLFDIQREMLVKSRTKLNRMENHHHRSVQGSAVVLSFRSETFDVVFMVTVLGEVPDPRECLAEIGRILRPGGVLSLTEQAGDPDALTQSELAGMGQAAGPNVIEAYPFRGGFTLNLAKDVAGP